MSEPKSWFEPEQMLPAQFFAGTAVESPERRLVLAVLEDAVNVYRRTARKTSKISRAQRREVETWFASNDRSWPFAFLNVCDVLGIEASALRSALDGWTSAPGVRIRLRQASGLRHLVRGRAAGLRRVA